MPKTFLKFLEPYEAELARKGLKKQGPIITVSGLSGSGKSLAARFILGAMPKLRYVYAGGLFRKMAKEKGMTIEEFSKTRPRESDYETDKWMLKESVPGSAVADGRLAAWVLGRWADARVLVACPIEIRAKRVALREKVSEKEAAEMLRERDDANARQYKRVYGLDAGDKKVYTHVIDNSGPASGLKRMVLDAVRNVIKN